ncbi:MAG: cation diffusion facilitator family transporter [Armatimonadetes bacterium]|nr:cation diffusion facilitator family transporter [Armatimonadota bacterium]
MARKPETSAKLAVMLRTAATGVALNLLFAAAKYALSLISGSVALRADAVHSLSDVVASATVLTGIKLSRRRSPNFPYGLYKVENLVALAAAVAILLTAYELAREAAGAALAEHKRWQVMNIPTAMMGVIAIGAATLAWSLYERNVARRTRSAALEADAAHVFTDVLSTAAIFAGLLASLAGWHVDWLVTLVVVALIALTGWHLAADAVRVLLDASVEREVLNAVEKAILQQPHVVAVKTLTGRNAGSFRFIEAVVQLDVHDLEAAHEVSRAIEEAVRNAAENVDQILVHYEPVQKEKLIYALPVQGDGATLAKHFGEAPQFALVTVRASDNVAEAVEYMPNRLRGQGHGRGIRIAEVLVKRGVDRIITCDDLQGHGPYYVFREAHVDIATTGAETLSQALAERGVRLPEGGLGTTG